MENDTINYYLFFNDENQVLMFYDRQNDKNIYPQIEEKTLEESYESRISKMISLLKANSSINDVLVLKKEREIYTRKTPFMEHALELLKSDESLKLYSYNGQYNLIEYSCGRYFFEVEFLLCNYYAKHINLTKEDYNKLKGLCETYNYDMDFVDIKSLYDNYENGFESAKRYLKKLDEITKYKSDIN